MKKFLSLVLVLTLVLALAAPVFAANGINDDSGKITVTNVTPGQTYSIYQILTLESYNTDTSAYAYKAVEAWKDFVKLNFDVDAQGYVTAKSGVAYEKLAKDALAFAKEHGIPAGKTATAGEGASEVVFENLNLGYYLVDSTVGTLCSLNTTKPEVEMEDKNLEPTVDKKVLEGETPSDKNDANIGDTITFQATITAQNGAENYVFHDKMSAGLTFTGVTGIKCRDVALSEGTDYTVKSTGLTDGCSFEVSFSKAFCDGLGANDKIVITYTAMVNESAVVGGENTNEAKLSYGENNNVETEPSQTVTKTWKMDVFKFTKKGETEAALAGATFTLSTAQGGEPIKLVSTEKDNVYRVATPEEADSAVTEITTDATGKFTIEGLDAGTYYLTETNAPDGYNKLADSLEVTIGHDGIVTTALGEGEVKVENKTGTELPSTGGIGTTIFYIVGAVLMAGAAILLITKKRMSAE